MMRRRIFADGILNARRRLDRRGCQDIPAGRETAMDGRFASRNRSKTPINSKGYTLNPYGF